MKKFVPIPTIESSLHLFGGHKRTVSGGWSFFEQKHQAFELLCILDGRQTTLIKGMEPMTYGPGDILIISPGTLHSNANASDTEDMTYISFHFNIESLELKSEIISRVANMVVSENSHLAKIAVRAAKKMIGYSETHAYSGEERKLKIQIVFLEFLYEMSHCITEFRQQNYLKYSEREAFVARSIATKIENGVENNDQEILNVSKICKSLNISTGYGHRVFKKVYGITPLHFIEEQKYRRAKLLLGTPEYSIEEISYMTGSNSLANFSKQFKKWSGITPSKYQQQVLNKRKVTNVKSGGYFE